MKTIPLVLMMLLFTVATRAQPAFQQYRQMPPNMPPGLPPAGAPGASTNVPVNYLICVDWNDTNNAPKSLEVLTTEGEFNLDTIQKNSVKIGNFDVPITLKLQGTLHALSDKKGRLDLYLGRSIPYVTGTFGPNASPSYNQMQVGLNSSFIVTFGKPLVIENDDNGAVTIVVKRMAD